MFFAVACDVQLWVYVGPNTCNQPFHFSPTAALFEPTTVNDQQSHALLANYSIQKENSRASLSTQGRARH